MSYQIVVDVEPRNKEFVVQVMKETTIQEVVETLVARCNDEGISVSSWAANKVGSSNVNFVMLRKATGSTALAPEVTFGELFPELNERETFKIDARAQVGQYATSEDIIGYNNYSLVLSNIEQNRKVSFKTPINKRIASFEELREGIYSVIDLFYDLKDLNIDVIDKLFDKYLVEFDSFV